jgi:hypothetical protein
MKKFLVIYCILCSHLLSAQQLTWQDISISLLTIEPGDALYSAFAHNAIRIKIDLDSVDYDVVCNYGTFAFNQPNFYANFVRGRMLYRLSAQTFDDFMDSYMYENRSVREQVLVLDSAQTVYMAQFIENNYLPENRHYRYHFFNDNCATRIRDLMLKTFDGIILPETQETPTFRNLIHRYLEYHTWGKFGIDIGLGLPTDQKTGIYEQMFLPDYVSECIAEISYNGHPVAKETKVLFIPGQPAVMPPGPVTPMVVCCFVLALALLFVFVRKGFWFEVVRIFDFTLFLVVGLTGLVVFFLWFFSDHTFTSNNLNIFWALPAHPVMTFFLLPRRRSNVTRIYFLTTAIIAVLLLVSWKFLPQPLNPALLPLVIAIVIRGGNIFLRP